MKSFGLFSNINKTKYIVNPYILKSNVQYKKGNKLKKKKKEFIKNIYI